MTVTIVCSSIGEGDQLKLFLEKNTYIPPELMLVDDYKFAAYNSAGLGKIGEKAALAVKGTRNMKPPKLKLKTWWSYLRNVGKLAPIPKNAKITSIPEGVTRLGATFGVVGNKVIFTYEDGKNDLTPLVLIVTSDAHSRSLTISSFY